MNSGLPTVGVQALAWLLTAVIPQAVDFSGVTSGFRHEIRTLFRKPDEFQYTSVGANYRSACRARYKPEFISKLGIVLEKADESGFWLELIPHSTPHMLSLK